AARSNVFVLIMFTMFYSVCGGNFSERLVCVNDFLNKIFDFAVAPLRISARSRIAVRVPYLVPLNFAKSQAVERRIDRICCRHQQNYRPIACRPLMGLSVLRKSRAKRSDDDLEAEQEETERTEILLSFRRGRASDWLHLFVRPHGRPPRPCMGSSGR